MGYFSNGSEGSDYEERHCIKCVHYADGACPVLDIHQLLNYEQFPEHCETLESKRAAQSHRVVLTTLIPRTDAGNNQCRMFHQED